MNEINELILPHNIDFQRQPDKLTCFAAVAGMIINKKVNLVIAELKERNITPPFTDVQMIPYLVRNNIFVERLNSAMMPLLLCNIIYMGIINNGLNSGNFHSVLFNIDENDGATILDPSKYEPYFKKSPMIFETIYSIYDCS